MIIEFFGPPGAGKTTLARALISELRKRGYSSEMAIEYQPDRTSSFDPGGFGHVLGRLVRAIAGVITMALHPVSNKDALRVVARLLRLLPPRNPVWFARFGQYLLRLARTWYRSADVAPIIVFDQGFVQAVCTLAVFSRISDEESLRQALTLVPEPDIVFLVSVNQNVQKDHLLSRRRSEPMMARLLEAGDSNNLQFAPVVKTVSAMLRQRWRSAIVVDVEPDSSIESLMGQIVRALAAKAEQQSAAPQSEVSDQIDLCELSTPAEDLILTTPTPAPPPIHNDQQIRKESTDERAGDFVRNSFGALLTYVFGAGLTSGAQFLLARVLHIEGYGIYSYVWAWVSLLSFGATLGLLAFVLRFTAAYQASGQWSLMYGSIRFAVSRAFAAALIVSGTGLVVLWLRRHQLDSGIVVSFVIGMAIIPLITLYQIGAGVVRVFGGYIVALLPERLFRDGFLLVTVGVIAWWKLWPVSAEIVLLLTLFGTAATLAFLTYAAFSLWPEAIRRVEPAYSTREWWSFMRPAMIMLCLEVAMARTGVLALGWSGRISDAGIFALAVNIAMMVQLSRTAVNNYFSPTASAAHARGDLAGLRSLFGRASLLSLAGGAVLAAPVLIFTGPILRLFGQGFAENAHVTQILVIGQLLAAAAGPQQNLLIMTGHERSAAASMLFFGALTIGGCVIAAIVYGAIGAAIVTSGALVAWNLAMALHIRWRLGIEPGLMLALKHCLARSGAVGQV